MSKHVYTYAPGEHRQLAPVPRPAGSPRPGRGQPSPRRRQPRRQGSASPAGGGGELLPAQGLILSYAHMWFALLENRKIYELRRHQIEIPNGDRRVLLVCNQKVRKQFGLSNQMAVSHCTKRLGPYTADEIISCAAAGSSGSCRHEPHWRGSPPPPPEVSCARGGRTCRVACTP